MNDNTTKDIPNSGAIRGCVNCSLLLMLIFATAFAVLGLLRR